MLVWSLLALLQRLCCSLVLLGILSLLPGESVNDNEVKRATF